MTRAIVYVDLWLRDVKGVDLLAFFTREDSAVRVMA